MALVSTDINPVLFVLDLHMKFIVEGTLYVHLLYGLYSVIAAPRGRSVGCVFADLYTFVDDSEHTWTMSCICHPTCFTLSVLIDGYIF